MKTQKHRLILPMQAKGNLGKSIETHARACWLDQRGIQWQGFDLDGDNQTFSRLFPDSVRLLPVNGRPEDQDDLISLLNRVTEAPVTLLDPRAHLDSQIMNVFKATHFFDVANRRQVGITIMIYPFDDIEVMDNIDRVLQFCKADVNYVIVRNPMRAPRTKLFDGSELEQDFLEHSAKVIQVPVLAEIVKLKLARLEHELGRAIAFHEAVASDSIGLEIMCRGILQDWLTRMFDQYDQSASVLLPTELACQIEERVIPAMDDQPVRKRGAKANLKH